MAMVDEKLIILLKSNERTLCHSMSVGFAYYCITNGKPNGYFWDKRQEKIYCLAESTAEEKDFSYLWINNGSLPIKKMELGTMHIPW